MYQLEKGLVKDGSIASPQSGVNETMLAEDVWLLAGAHKFMI